MIIGSMVKYSPMIGLKWAWMTRFYYRDPASVQAYQDRKLRELIIHAGVHVPYYRKLFADIGLDVTKFRGREDMEKIPLLTKEQVQERPSDFVADNAIRFSPVVYRTSGSTGTPLRFLLSRESKIMDAAATLRSYAWAGYYPFMKVFSLKIHAEDWVYRYHMLGRSLDLDTVHLTPENGIKVWKAINRLKPPVFHGYPIALLMLHEIGKKAGIRMHRPRSVITLGESMPVYLRSRLERAFQASVFDHYGMSENAALISSCTHGRYHVCEDYAYHEFIDINGRPVRENFGEIVSTSFYNYAMPLIRYRTRDYARLSSNPGECGCGSRFRQVEELEGRIEDYIVTPDGRRVNLFECALNHTRGIAMSQYVQDTPDSMYVNIIPGSGFGPQTLIEAEKGLRKRVGQIIRIRFQLMDEPDQMERRSKQSRKIPFLISKIGNRVYQN